MIDSRENIIMLPKAVSEFAKPNFENILIQEIQQLDADLLPLQQGLSQSSYVSDSKFNVVILNVTDGGQSIMVKAGIFYGGIIAGSCCADDPTPVEEQTEYCELQLEINKNTAITSVYLNDIYPSSITPQGL